MIEVFVGKVRANGFIQKAGFSSDSERIFGISHNPSTLQSAYPGCPSKNTKRKACSIPKKCQATTLIALKWEKVASVAASGRPSHGGDMEVQILPHTRNG
jgi:hypothetical protein